MTTDEKWLTREMCKRFTRIRLRSFEACRIPSVPDLLAIVKFEYGAEQFWIEAKKIKRISDPTPYNGGQEKWIEDFEEDGGNVLILCLVTSSRQVVLRRIWHTREKVIDLLNPRWPEALENLLIESL
jgi:hypothetical protein